MPAPGDAEWFSHDLRTNITPLPRQRHRPLDRRRFSGAPQTAIRRDAAAHPQGPTRPYRGIRGRTPIDLRLCDGSAADEVRTSGPVRTSYSFASEYRWNRRFDHAVPAALPPSSSASWPRGRYCDVLCIAQFIRRAAWWGDGVVSGAVDRASRLPRSAAPDSTQAGLASRGWTAAVLRTYFGRGNRPASLGFHATCISIGGSHRNLTARTMTPW